MPIALGSIVLALLAAYVGGFSGFALLLAAAPLWVVLFFAVAFVTAWLRPKLAKGPPEYGKVSLSITPPDDPPKGEKRRKGHRAD